MPPPQPPPPPPPPPIDDNLRIAYQWVIWPFGVILPAIDVRSPLFCMPKHARTAQFREHVNLPLDGAARARTLYAPRRGGLVAFSQCPASVSSL